MLPAPTGRSQTKKSRGCPAQAGQPLPYTTDGRAPGRPDQIFSTLRADRHEGLGLKRLFFFVKFRAFSVRSRKWFICLLSHHRR